MSCFYLPHILLLHSSLCRSLSLKQARKMAMILDAFVGKFVERLMAFVEEKAAMVLGVKEELERLQSKIGWIQNVLEDTERRSLEESAINHWVNKLKDVMYDADDIIGLCMRAQLLPDEQQPSSSSRNSPPVSCINYFLSCFISAPRRYEIGERIKSIKDRLEEICKDRLQFNLDPGSTKTRVTAVNRHQTSPVLAELDVVGREIEDATEELVKLMIAGEVKKKWSVFAITGMRGIGKTTLAQKIFNHRKVQGKFQIKVWICISQTYNEIELLKQIIRNANGSYGEAKTKAELEPVLKSAVLGRSLFLVLDDVWRANVWIDLLRRPLQSARIDSSVLITSRDDTVAKQMGSVHIHHVMHLPVERLGNACEKACHDRCKRGRDPQLEGDRHSNHRKMFRPSTCNQGHGWCTCKEGTNCDRVEESS